MALLVPAMLQRLPAAATEKAPEAVGFTGEHLAAIGRSGAPEALLGAGIAEDRLDLLAGSNHPKHSARTTAARVEVLARLVGKQKDREYDGALDAAARRLAIAEPDNALTDYVRAALAVRERRPDAAVLLLAAGNAKGRADLHRTERYRAVVAAAETAGWSPGDARGLAAGAMTPVSALMLVHQACKELLAARVGGAVRACADAGGVIERASATILELFVAHALIIASLRSSDEPAHHTELALVQRRRRRLDALWRKHTQAHEGALSFSDVETARHWDAVIDQGEVQVMRAAIVARRRAHRAGAPEPSLAIHTARR